MQLRIHKQRSARMGQIVAVKDLKEANIFINENQKLESNPKTSAAIMNGSLDRIWVKFKDTLEINTESVLQVKPKDKTFSYIKKHAVAARKNKTIAEYVSNLKDLGYSEI